MSETLQMPALAADGLDFDAPLPWSVVPVETEAGRVYHITDARGHSLLSSTGINGRGSELQRRMLERICAAVNTTAPTVEGLARAVVHSDERGDSWSTKRHAASALLAQAVLGLGGVR